MLTCTPNTRASRSSATARWVSPSPRRTVLSPRPASSVGSSAVRRARAAESRSSSDWLTGSSDSPNTGRSRGGCGIVGRARPGAVREQGARRRAGELGDRTDLPGRHRVERQVLLAAQPEQPGHALLGAGGGVDQPVALADRAAEDAEHGDLADERVGERAEACTSADRWGRRRPAPRSVPPARGGPVAGTAPARTAGRRAGRRRPRSRPRRPSPGNASRPGPRARACSQLLVVGTSPDRYRSSCSSSCVTISSVISSCSRCSSSASPAGSASMWWWPSPSYARPSSLSTSATPVNAVSSPSGSSSGTSPSPKASRRSASTCRKSARALSSLVTTTMRGTPASAASRHTACVPAWTPSTALTTTSARSAAARAASTAPAKSADPGVSSSVTS